ERKIARMISQGNGSWQHSTPTPVSVKPGAITQVTMGGTGTTVVGKIHVPVNDVNYQNVHASLHNPLPEAFKKARTPEEQAKSLWDPETKLAMKNYRHYPVVVSADGSFRADEVLPGKYDLEITGQHDFERTLKLRPESSVDPSEFKGRYHREVVVSEAGANQDLIDLGTLECEAVPEASASNK